MGRQLVLALIASAFAFELRGQAPAEPSATPVPASPNLLESPAGAARDEAAKRLPLFLQKRFAEMSPEDRQHLERNAERWMKMSPEERAALRANAEDRREHIRQEAQAAARDAGLSLDEHRREIFERRYMQERHQFEQSLRKEMDERRQQELPAIIARLKAEFEAQGQVPARSTTPAASP
jgi:hypothetical protein